MTEPISTTSAGGFALFKFFGGIAVASAVASMLGFLLMWPRSAREAAVRLTCTFIASSCVGPFLVVALHSRAPELFDSGRQMALLVGLPADAGLVFVSSPLLVAAGLPAWWILGALVRWLDKRKGADLGQLVYDARQLFSPNPAAPTNRRKK
ncbi:MAG: hypothetical protein ACXWVD_00305 [Telluria sp.]